MKLLLTLLLCGLGCVAADRRIVGGMHATEGDHPYICSIQYSGYHLCGSVIWNTRYLVTAAHCLQLFSAQSLRAFCGKHDLSKTEPYQQERDVAAYVIHPEYDLNTRGIPNDIAVVELLEPLSFNEGVQSYSLASGGSFVGQSCVLTGWGMTSGGGASPSILHKVNMTAIGQEECRQLWSNVPDAVINDQHICFHEEGKSACSGDSGGPVRCGHVITGITSWGVTSCSGSYPSVYTRVSAFHSWVAGIAGPQ